MSVFTRDSDIVVLVLPGVSLSELISIDKLWGDIEGESQPEIDKQKPTKLPDYIFNLTEWPQRCNLKCKTCHMRYNTIPIPMPIKSITNSKGNCGFARKFSYCSFPCCMRDISRIVDTRTREYRFELLKLMFKYVFNMDMTSYSFECSPDPDELEDYGGEMTEDEYRKKINKMTNKMIQGSLADPKSFLLALQPSQ